MGVKPKAESLRTKTPILPQKMPARMISAGPRKDGFAFFMFRITSCIDRVLPRNRIGEVVSKNTS